MEAPSHPVLRYLAVMRAARDFGLEPGELDALARRFPPAGVAAFSDAVADALLRSPAAG